MRLLNNDIPLVFLHPGNYHFSDKSEVISTVLGSCVTVFLYSRKSSPCGITHSLLPCCQKSFRDCSACSESYRYTDCSIIRLIEDLKSCGLKTEEIEAKVFGGAGIINSSAAEANSIGKQNIEQALQILNREGIRIVASDLGGARGRKLFIFSESREVLLSRLR